MKMPAGQIQMIEAVAAANPNTVVVLCCGSAVECPWADSVKAILYMGLPGQAGGEAAADLLYGRANPGGRLAESWPYRYEDVPSSEIYDKTTDALYQEGIYVGYRYYDKAGVAVRWPFGYGLSYTSFSYADLQVDGRRVTVTVERRDGRPVLTVADTGIGIPYAEQSRVFERFYRVDKSHSGRGTGLGLSIVKHGAAFHGAQVSLQSREGEGTTVTLTFPEAE